MRTCYWCVGGTLLTGCDRPECPASEAEETGFDIVQPTETQPMLPGACFVDPFDDGG